MAPNPNTIKIKEACDAMKVYGYSMTKVRSALKELLKTYVNNWGLIEDENYKVLVNYIVEEDELKAKEKKEKEAKKQSNSKSKGVATNSREKRKAPEKQTQALVIYNQDDESEEEDDAPLKKRLRRRPTRICDDNGTSSSGSSVSKKAREEDSKREEEEEDDRDNMPLKLYLRRSVEKNSAITLYNNASSSFKSPMSMEPEMNSNAGALIVREDDHLINHQPLISDSAPVHEMENSKMLTNSDSGALMILSDLPFTAPELTVPGNSSALILGIENSNLSSAVEESNAREASSVSELELASSSLGEAKISLSFTPATGEDTTNLRLPSMEDIMRAMEEKCLKTYQITNSDFSVRGFMKDMCTCYIDLAKNPTKQTLEASGESSSMGLVVVPECEISADGWRAISNIQDITYGEESVMIPWKNEINEEIPSPFPYISQSVVFQEASVKYSLSSFSDEQCCFSCIGDCLVSSSSSAPCKCTTAYTVDGLLKDVFLEERISEALDIRKQELMFCKVCPVEKAKKEETLETCKGHIKRKAIKECWINCSCTRRCGNRTVQKGIHNKLEVFYTSDGKGWGLRTVEKLRKGAFVCEYIGEILTVSELYQRSLEDKLASSAPVILDAFWGCSEESLEDNKALCLDGTRYGNISRFINHRCLDANLIEIPVHIETPDQHYYHLAFFTTRDIEPMEELTWDYGVDFDNDDSLMKPFGCLCGSRLCRNNKRSKKGKKVMNRA